MAILGASPAAATPPWILLCALGAALAAAALCLWGAWRALDRWWLRPRRLGNALRSQGLPGTAYRFPSGDMKEYVRLAAAARAEPMPLASHAIPPRVVPFDHSITRQHGSVAVTWFGPEPRVIVNDPRLIREILANRRGHFGKQKSMLWVERLLANGLTTHQGQKWATHRRIVNHAFHFEKLKSMLPAFAACSSELVRRWEESVGSDGVQEIDVWPEFTNLTGDVISRAAFGSSFTEGRRIFQLQSEQAQNAVKMVSTMHIPGYRFLPTQFNKRMKAISREVEELLRGIISKRERAMKDGLNSDDLLGLLLESNLKESQESGSAKPMMTTEDIIGELKLFYFAGMETTAVLLTWTMIVLSMHQEWQDRAREEVLRIFGKNQPDSEGINQLKIVTMILHEVLRLYPPILLIGRETYQETDWRCQVPTWCCVFVPICVRPPQSRCLGRRCGRIQAREVRGRCLQGIQGCAGVLSVWLGTTDLCWSELRVTGGQDGLGHDPAALLVRALTVLHTCTLRDLHSAATVRGTD